MPQPVHLPFELTKRRNRQDSLSGKRLEITLRIGRTRLNQDDIASEGLRRLVMQLPLDRTAPGDLKDDSRLAYPASVRN